MAAHARILVAALIAATALAFGVGGASARRLGVSEISWLTHVRAMTFEGSGIRVVCAMSLEGSFHSRTMEKVARALLGYITEGRFKRPCTGGEIWMQTRQEGREESLPWHILYERFIGTLPNITGIEGTSDNTLYSIEVSGIRCAYRASTASPLKGIGNREEGGKATSVRANETASIAKVEGSALCPATLIHAGEGIAGAQPTYREISITLVA